MVIVRKVCEPGQIPYAKRFLIERLWPQDHEGTALRFEGWLKDLAPSEGLCNWFRNDPHKWEVFRQRYFSELDARPEAWCLLLEEARRGVVELLYNRGDLHHNNAAALKEYLETKLSRALQPGAKSSGAIYMFHERRLWHGYSPSKVACF
ncbi:MAG: DUF488 family protein [Acidobacteriota bacterium]|nr:DUF488 family protein [Acidobacteriota bacterium]